MKPIITTLLLTLSILMACTNQTIPADAKEGIGVLIKNRPLGISNPSEYQLPDGNLYAGLPFRVGQINLSLDDPSKAEALVGKLVMYRYAFETDLNRVLKKIGPAPANYGMAESSQQLRSDWVAPETGFNIGRTTPEVLSTTPWHRVFQIRELAGFSIKVEGDVVTVTATNPLKETLESLKVIAHYEGGRGKPSPTYATQEAKNLESGSSKSFSFATKADDPEAIEGKASSFNFESAIIELQTKTQSFNFEIFPASP